jgi:hypothetical protein
MVVRALRALAPAEAGMLLAHRARVPAAAARGQRLAAPSLCCCRGKASSAAEERPVAWKGGREQHQPGEESATPKKHPLPSANAGETEEGVAGVENQPAPTRTGEGDVEGAPKTRDARRGLGYAALMAHVDQTNRLRARRDAAAAAAAAADAKAPAQEAAASELKSTAADEGDALTASQQTTRSRPRALGADASPIKTMRYMSETLGFTPSLDELPDTSLRSVFKMGSRMESEEWARDVDERTRGVQDKADGVPGKAKKQPPDATFPRAKPSDAPADAATAAPLAPASSQQASSPPKPRPANVKPSVTFYDQHLPTTDSKPSAMRPQTTSPTTKGAPMTPAATTASPESTAAAEPSLPASTPPPSSAPSDTNKRPSESWDPVTQGGSSVDKTGIRIPLLPPEVQVLYAYESVVQFGRLDGPGSKVGVVDLPPVRELVAAHELFGCYQKCYNWSKIEHVRSELAIPDVAFLGRASVGKSRLIAELGRVARLTLRPAESYNRYPAIDGRESVAAAPETMAYGFVPLVARKWADAAPDRTQVRMRVLEYPGWAHWAAKPNMIQHMGKSLRKRRQIYGVVFVVNSNSGVHESDKAMLEELVKRDIPFVVALGPAHPFIPQTVEPWKGSHTPVLWRRLLGVATAVTELVEGTEGAAALFRGIFAHGSSTFHGEPVGTLGIKWAIARMLGFVGADRSWGRDLERPARCEVVPLKAEEAPIQAALDAGELQLPDRPTPRVQLLRMHPNASHRRLAMRLFSQARKEGIDDDEVQVPDPTVAAAERDNSRAPQTRLSVAHHMDVNEASSLFALKYGGEVRTALRRHEERALELKDERQRWLELCLLQAQQWARMTGKDESGPATTAEGGAEAVAGKEKKEQQQQQEGEEEGGGLFPDRRATGKRTRSRAATRPRPRGPFAEEDEDNNDFVEPADRGDRGHDSDGSEELGELVESVQKTTGAPGRMANRGRSGSFNNYRRRTHSHGAEEDESWGKSGGRGRGNRRDGGAGAGATLDRTGFREMMRRMP